MHLSSTLKGILLVGWSSTTALALVVNRPASFLERRGAFDEKSCVPQSSTSYSPPLDMITYPTHDCSGPPNAPTLSLSPCNPVSSHRKEDNLKIQSYKVSRKFVPLATVYEAIGFYKTIDSGKKCVEPHQAVYLPDQTKCIPTGKSMDLDTGMNEIVGRVDCVVLLRIGM